MLRSSLDSDRESNRGNFPERPYRESDWQLRLHAPELRAHSTPAEMPWSETRQGVEKARGHESFRLSGSGVKRAVKRKQTSFQSHTTLVVDSIDARLFMTLTLKWKRNLSDSFFVVWLNFISSFDVYQSLWVALSVKFHGSFVCVSFLFSRVILSILSAIGTSTFCYATVLILISQRQRFK